MQLQEKRGVPTRQPKGIVYQASVTSSEGTEHYVGHTDTDFKARFANHKQSLKTEKYSNQTELSKYV